MAKGTEAKNLVAKKIAEAFGVDYIGEFDKKIYVQAKENGEYVQIALSMTCPKNPVVIPGSAEIFSNEENPNIISSNEKVYISDEEKNNVINLMEKLGL